MTRVKLPLDAEVFRLLAQVQNSGVTKDIGIERQCDARLMYHI